MKYISITGGLPEIRAGDLPQLYSLSQLASKLKYSWYFMSNVETSLPFVCKMMQCVSIKHSFY
jgi:hypothetical protein